MSPLIILKFPNPVLKKRSQPVTQFGEELKNLAGAMLDAMYKKGGIGLAGPQVGQLRRLIVVDVRDGGGEKEEEKRNPMVLVNPVILKKSGEIVTEEGCLSVVDYTAEIKRARWIVVEYNSPRGETEREELEGIKAVCVQHEIDHLEGKLFIDRLPLLKRQLVRKRLAKLSRSA